MYPVTNYTMEIKQVSSGSDVQSFASVTNCIIVDGLLENVIYMFRITAVNSASSASSDAIKVCKLTITCECQFRGRGIWGGLHSISLLDNRGTLSP